MTLIVKTAGFSAVTTWSGSGSPTATRWRPAVDRIHGISAIAALSGTSLLCLASPLAGEALHAWGGALLLVGGALIGVPHGSSDFVVAHRLMHPAFAWRWLPIFLISYLALVAVAMAAWFALPLVTLIGFLFISGLHFGAGDMRDAALSGRPGLAFAVRATTPVLPIFMIHPEGVADFIAALGGVSEPATLHLLHVLRWPLLLPWGVALAVVALPALLTGGRRALDAAVLLSITLAAIALPPLPAFGLYFCLVHAVQHMLEIAADHHPARPCAAAALAAAIVMPSALICLVALWFAWDGLAGLLDTDAVVTWGLRIIAALTVPHMALEWMASHRAANAHREGQRREA